ncbi:MAG: RNA polymerase factor sigma-54 [Muribaculaceae bacterium]|nr:RNA polymerase factor sigma-54 [Muribaculaceae bacterium]
MATEESLKLSTEQKLQQRLTPMQVEFGKMLEMTGLEVEDEVRRVLDENPALEQCDNDERQQNLTEGSDETFNETAEDVQLADYRDEDDIPAYRLEARNYSADDNYYEPIAVDSSDTLIEILEAQLMEYDLDETQLAVAKYIIGNLDDNGYLTRSISAICDDLAFNAGLDIPLEEIKKVYEIVKSLDPAGVGAVDLRDCLLLQLNRKEKNRSTQIAFDIIKDYFDLFSKKHYDRMKSALDINAEELRDAMNVITSLNPKPGSIITGGSSDRTRHIIPDFSIETDLENGDITLTLLNRIPELQIEETFSEKACEIPSNASRSQREAATFIKQKRDEASNFIKILKMRQDTLYRVMTAIVKIQRDFFLTDDEKLIRPMILRDIAEITKLDLSVISRATAGKYVMTQRGIYPLKLFFNERPIDNEDTSSHEILAVLKDIIANEDKNKPLSDDVITKILTEKGYDIARRTVAKYRDKLGLPVARLRKKL